MWAAGQADSPLVAGGRIRTEESYILEDHTHVDVPLQGYSTSDLRRKGDSRPYLMITLVLRRLMDWTSPAKPHPRQAHYLWGQDTSLSSTKTKKAT